MKTKFAVFLVLLAAMGGSLFAQQPQVASYGNPQGANLTASDTGACTTAQACVWQHLPTNAGTTTVNLAGTFTATLLVEESNNGGGTWTTAATLSAAGTSTFSTNGFTDIRVRCSAFTSGPIQVSVSTGLQQVQSVVTVQSSGGSGLTVGLDPRNFGAKFNAKWVYIANIPTNTATPTITCTTCAFTSADVGKDVQGAAGSTGGAAHITARLALPVTTITTVNSATSITTGGSSNANATGAANNTLAWGTNDSAAMKATFDAAWLGPNCQGVQFPSGGTMLNTSFDSNVNNGCNNGFTNATRMGAWVTGGGRAGTTLLMESSFNFATQCTGLTFGANGPGCLFSVNGIQLEHFGIWGIENAATGTGSVFSLIALGADSGTLDFNIYGWAAADANVVGLNMTLPNVIYTNVDGAGAIPCVSQSNGGFTLSLDTSFCGDSLSSAMFIAAGGGVRSQHTTFGVTGTGATPIIQNNNVWYSSQDSIITNAGVTGQTAIAGLTGSFTDLNDITDINNAATSDIAISQAGSAVIKVRGKSQLAGGSAASTWACGTNPQGCQDEGSVYVGSYLPGFYVSPNSVNGTCTGVVAAASTLGLYGTGPNVTATTCAAPPPVGSGVVMKFPGTLQSLNGTATAAGVNASSGVATVLKNGGATAITCTFGTTTACNDGTHTVAVVAGDLVSIQFTTQAADTLAGVKLGVAIAQ